MRIRLTIQRYSLPAANVLWNVTDTNSAQAYTITRLLEDVNHVIPLEAEHWGLEHYVVEVAGFECLHFSPVAQALKEDDHVCIRPLMTAEVRARTLTGRHQISDDGRHLVDGVPFGRPYLRHPNRPAVRIPPRKRRRLDDADEDAEIGMLTPNGESPPTQDSVGLLTNGDTGAGSQRPSAARKPSKTVQFQTADLEDDEDSDEDDDDFAPGAEQDDDVTSGDSSDSSDSSDSDSGSSSASDASSSDSDSDDSSSDSDSDSDASAPPDVQSSKTLPVSTKKRQLTGSPKNVAPGHGASGTKSRNSRRARTNRLRFLKADGKLPRDADLAALGKYDQGLLALPSPQPEPSKPFSTYEGKRKRIDTDEVGEAPEDATELDLRKRELMARFGDDTAGTMARTEEPAEKSVTSPASSSPSKPGEDELSKAETPRKRLRPDTSAISRILARQAMPSRRKPKNQPVVEKTPEPEGASEPDFWKSRINVSAFECWDEEYELTAPPYPFKQHWDPVSKIMREKADKKKQKRFPKKQATPPVQEEEEEEEEEKIFLDYDGTGATESADVETNAAIEDQLRQDVATAAQLDLPLLPEDMSTLQALTPADIQVGATIACKFFDVNPITITPEISDYKTATVDREGDSGNGAGTIRLKIAERDLPKREKKFDSNGNRIYDGAADQFYMENEDDEDEGLWEGQFSELIEPKLVKAA